MVRAAHARPQDADAPSLDARPKAETRTIEDLVEEARKGRVRIPRFQRGLKWLPSDALLLFDSIYRGYPIGTLLFWQTPAEAEQVRFGPLSIDADKRGDAWWVVDGQQRLTSLVRALLGDQPDDFSLWFDLDHEKFVRESQAKTDAARFLPLTEVVDTERLHHWVGARELSQERRRAAFRLNKRIREYAVPAYIVETTNQDILRKIFERTNSSGKALDKADVFDALHGARGTEEPADFEAIAASLTDLGFGVIDEGILYRSLLAIHGKDVVGGDVPTSFPEGAAGYARTARSTRAGIVFLMGHVGIPHVGLLPYKQPLVALAKFFDRHSEPSARSRGLLARWIWRGAWSGLHSGDTVSTRVTLDAIDDDEDGSVQRLLGRIPNEEPKEASAAPYNFRNARSKLDVLALLSRGPRHTATGTRILPSSVTGPDAISIVVGAGEASGTIAGRLVHPAMAKLRSALAHADASIRESHAVSPDAFQALLDGDDTKFLEIRGRDVQGVTLSFLRSRAKWGESDRPPIRALRVADED